MIHFIQFLCHDTVPTFVVYPRPCWLSVDYRLVNSFGTGESPLVVQETLSDGLLLQPLEFWLNPLFVRKERLHEVQNASCSFLALIFICYAALAVALVCLRLNFFYLSLTSSTVSLRDAIFVSSNRMKHAIRKSVFLPVSKYPFFISNAFF